MKYHGWPMDAEAAYLDLLGKLSAANARIAELEKDAARYRWIREHSTQPAEPWSTHSTPESLDDAIDAALRGILG